jgi:nickel-dependent lactate racemase
VVVRIPEGNFVYFAKPHDPDSPKNDEDIRRAVQNPIGVEPLSRQIRFGMKVVVVVDDLTRSTPHKRLLPILLGEINNAGVSDWDITLVVALGTHRYMSQEEMILRYGAEIAGRVTIVNNKWKKKEQFIDLGTTALGTPVLANKIVVDADYVIGVGSIVPHDLAGWSGGSKIIQPGVCSSQTTQFTHLSATRGDLLANLGNPDNPVRLEIEAVAEKIGIDFIVNVVHDRYGEVYDIVCGHPIKAHRAGVESARSIYEVEIPEQMDIVLTNAYPADLDYWQGIKPLLFAQKAVKKNGTVILFGRFAEGVSPTHRELIEFGTQPPEQIEALHAKGEIEDGVCAAALLVHSKCLSRSRVICVSDGLSRDDQIRLGFASAPDLDGAIEMALRQQGAAASIGVIDFGGDLIPKLHTLKP